MALEDFAMFRAVATSICFYPSDAVSCERAIELAAQTKGITFTRTSRPPTAVIYANDEKFEIGKGKVRNYQCAKQYNYCYYSTNHYMLLASCYWLVILVHNLYYKLLSHTHH